MPRTRSKTGPVLAFALVLTPLWAACDPGRDDKEKPGNKSDTAEPDAAGLDTSADSPDEAESGASFAWNLPKGLESPPAVPDDNPMSAEKVALGHRLFMDKRLSVDGSRSCYSCHQNHLGNADGRTKALGAANKDLTRNTPTIWNVGYHSALYWDGRAPTLEKQALGALKGGNMGLGDGLEAKAAQIGSLEEYAAEFKSVFELGEGAAVTADHVAKALSAYERTLLCGDSAYDTQTLDEAQTRGQKVFMQKGGCITCHTGPALSDDKFRITGVGIVPGAEGADIGHGKVSKSESDNYAFRTPTLRNVTKTAPYFHDGSVASLEEAVRIMASGGQPKEGLGIDENLKDRQLSDAEIADLVAFLGALDCPGTLEEIGDQSAEGIAPPS